MSTERSGGLPPIDPSRTAGDTKAAREEKQKVEKVREIDADEETQRRRKKFQMMMGDEDVPADLNPRAPSPFETEFYATSVPSVEPGSTAAAGGLFQSGSFSEEENAIVPSPSYSPPPNVSSPISSQEDASDTGNLPQSNDFWDDLDFPPDQPLQQPQLQESPPSAARTNQPGTGQTQSQAAQSNKTKTPSGKSQPVPAAASTASPFGPPGKTLPAGMAKPEKQPPAAKNEKPPFFAQEKPPGKTSSKTETAKDGSEGIQMGIPTTQKEKKTASQPSFTDKMKKTPTAIPEEETIPSMPFQPSGRTSLSKEAQKGQKTNQEEYQGTVPLVPGQTETGSSKKDREGKEERKIDIVSPSLPPLPVDIQPAAQAAATQAAPYLRPETLSLFYQMVGTIYAMTGPTGISRTEIVLNNPAFADSKFYGATITIEKYATAPDSLNIRLTGSDTAVATFKENIPSLMTAFQNGNFTFRVNRVDAEYAVIRPYFRRKEKGEGGETGSGLGDRRR